ncbi:MAG: hypothetical protein FJ249_09825 [Nitrospira sp.]|nr:hypothetical protein [Nitrospira sp.]
MGQGTIRGRAARRAFLASLLVYLLAWFLLPSRADSSAEAACSVDRSPAGPVASMTLHLGKDCTRQDRDAQVVMADDLLAAIAEGKGIDLVGAVVAGDLLLDRLPVQTVRALPNLPASIQAAIERQGLKEIRVITVPISIRDSVVRGAISTRIKDGLVVIKEPLTMAGTTFEGAVDLSQAAFAGPVDFSQAIFLKEGFFIHALFTQATRFEKTALGLHSRFHRAQFFAPVTFHRAGFNGLAEFIQVTFEKDASFAQAYFRGGTGFSGSRFQGLSDFSEAVFEREAFFMFTVFEQDAYFRRVTFRAETNFSDSEFKGLDDFSKTFFTTEPKFTRAKISGTPPRRGGLQDPRVLYIIAAALLAFTLVFVFVLRKR